MAGLLDLHLGDQLEHVDHPPQAKVAPLGNDHEVFLDPLPRPAGEQAADLLQGLADLHGEEVIAHQPADGLAGEQVGGEGLEQRIGEQVAVDDADGLLLIVQHGHRVQVGLHAEGLQHFADGRVAVHRRLLVEQGLEVGAVLAQLALGAVQQRQVGAGLSRRVLLGPAEQVTLHQVQAHLGQHGQFLAEFNALGDDLGAGGLGHLQDGADELALHRVLVDAVDEVAVDLHVVGAQLRPQAQAGIARTQVVQGDGEAHGAVVVQGGVEQGEVIGGGVLGEFDDHLARRDAESLQHLQGAARLVGRVQQGFGGDVEEQLAVELQLMEAGAGALAAGHLQFAQPSGVTGHGEQGDGGVQRAVGGAAGQGLVAEDAPLGKGEDRLEQAVQVAVSEDLAQGAQLLGDCHEGLSYRRR